MLKCTRFAARSVFLSSAIAGAVLLATAAQAATTPPGPSPALDAAKSPPKPASTVEQTIIGSAATAEQTSDSSIRPFQFHATDEQLADLKRRILATRWPEKETVPDSSQGVPLETMRGRIAAGDRPVD